MLPLVGAARAVVLDAVAGVDVDAAVGEPHGDLHLDLAVGGEQDGADVVGEPDPVRGGAEPVADDVVVGDLRALIGRRRRDGHASHGFTSRRGLSWELAAGAWC